MVSSPKIAILLATHNGETYLDEQLESLVAQDYSDWMILARDDGSSDRTVECLERWATREPRLQLLPPSEHPSGAASQNFSVLLEAALDTSAELFCCCDQDDVWHPQKLSVLSQSLELIETGADGRKLPSLVHSDLEVVDKTLNPIHPSFVQRMGLSPASEADACRLLSKNEVTGCAMIFNRALLEQVVPIPDQAIMHDWWIAVIAAYVGVLRFVSEPLVRYRQHDSNTLGARTIWHGLNPLTNWRKGWRRGNREYLRTVSQARSLYVHLNELSVPARQDIEQVRQYGQIAGMSRRQRLRAASRLSMWHGSLMLDSVLFARLMLLPRAD